MTRWILLLALGLGGCAHAPPLSEPNVSQYHSRSFAWRGVARMVILPMRNEVPHQPGAAEEVRRSLHAELQQLAMFEAVPAPPELTARIACCVRDGGRFSEAEFVDLARCGGADVILVGTLTHYSPYQRPRIGLTLQAISPDLGKVVASVDGLWDATDHDVADRARAYYARVRTFKDHVCDTLLGRWENSYGTDLVLESPHLFQRFVCSEAARLLVGLPACKPIDEPPPWWTPGTVLLTVKAWIESGLPKKPPCPPPTAQADNKKADADKKSPAEKKAADKEAGKKPPEEKKGVNTPPAQATPDKEADKPPVLPPPTPQPEK